MDTPQIGRGRTGRACRWSAGLACAALLVTGCAAQTSAGAGAPSGTGGGGVTVTAPAPATPQRSDPPAPPSSPPVARHGRPAHPTIAASAGAFAASLPARWSDGVVLTVARVRHGSETGRGPGDFTGQPFTAVTFQLRNGSDRTLDLSAVVVSASYGTPARVAAPVYDDTAQDFAGSLPPGASATATYLYAFPPSALASATATVDLDGVHAVAQLRGGLR
ncbi:hypothetical protein [Nakamurella endophytica]|uniref:DUF4352 domain-containing protein n=1 Tax=Nakamurella endophytica TaxID=1748367 RepID=A0A917T1R7_9ACTN|nr:hypothetical protein [Nakamurella endophytica]GGM05884.1 hypothetical protein GCM10011594_27640 [Nakamurella endophytica]